jgi:hypothetical protein
VTAPDPRLDEIQAIPAQAVEAAAKAAAKDEDASNWVDENEYYRNGWRNRMQVGLEAAHPVLLAELRKAREALARVEAECRYLDTLADGDRYYAKVIRAAVAAANGDGR